MTFEARITALMERKAAEFAARPDMASCALTGSLARGMLWEGSDLDFWGFREGKGGFEDGVEDDIYWEIDVETLSWLRGWNEARFLQPPRFCGEEFGITAMEALWGARVLFDREGTLTQVVALVQRLTGDREWMRQRASNYLRYGLEQVATLEAEAPTRAILDARKIAIVYGVNAYWMQQGKLVSSAVRIPERLADSPTIQNLFRQIFALEGQPGWERFWQAYQSAPDAVREEADSDMQQEILPTVALGVFDGCVCHFRFIADGWLPLDDVWQLMGFEADLEVQKQRVLLQTMDFLRQIEAL